MPSRLHPFLLSLLSALMLSAGWYFGLTVFVFFAWVPLLILGSSYSATSPRRRLKIFGFAYLTFLLWNIFVTWWVSCVQFGKEGAILAFLANSLLMAIVFLFFSDLKYRIGKPWAIWLLIPLWLAWEHLHTLWDLTWVWLTLGNAFAFKHHWVQWYEYTGTSGGTLWILTVNILAFETMRKNPGLRIWSKPMMRVGLLIVLPILLSYLIYFTRQPLSENGKKYSTVVVQPNIDPYNDKFNLDFQTQFIKSLELLKNRINEETEYLVFPETFITYDLNEREIEHNEIIAWFRDSLLQKFPKLKIIVGASTFAFYPDAKSASATARKNRDGEYYDMYNTGMQIDTAGVQLYHKSKLVPAVERMPFPALMKPLESLALDLGGTSGSLGMQNERVSFSGNGHTVGVGTPICYESVYADFVTEYIRKGASFIFIITNDGWWDNTPGHQQHLNYARLRAIENRRQIARSANTGISCFIDEFGNISQPTEYWKEAVITGSIVPNFTLTLFSRFGDLISYTSVLLAALLWAYSIFLRFKGRVL